jgi:hypothetical protein
MRRWSKSDGCSLCNRSASARECCCWARAESCAKFNPSSRVSAFAIWAKVCPNASFPRMPRASASKASKVPSGPLSELQLAHLFPEPRRRLFQTFVGATLNTPLSLWLEEFAQQENKYDPSEDHYRRMMSQEVAKGGPYWHHALSIFLLGI